MTDFNRRRFVLGAASALVAPTLSLAQDKYPSKPIRMLVPWTPGTPADIAARTVADALGAGLGGSVYVDNKNGAAGTVAVPEIRRAPADGYTIYVLASASLVSPVLYPSSDIDFVKQFDAVGQLEWSYNVLCVSPEKPYRSVADLVKAIKANPGKITYASGGNGTPPHLAGEMLNIEAGLKTIHVPYVQMGQAATDVMSGLADFIFMGAAGSVPLIKGGRLRPLAVSASQRVAALPDVPTMAESGFPNFVIRPFDGLLVKKGTPPEVIERLNRELNKVLGRATSCELVRRPDDVATAGALDDVRPDPPAIALRERSCRPGMRPAKAWRHGVRAAAPQHLSLSHDRGEPAPWGMADTERQGIDEASD